MIQPNRPSITSGVIAALFLILLAACGGGTEIPIIEAVSFKPEFILILAGDLPTEYSGAETTHEGVAFLEEDLNLAQNWVHQDIARMNEHAGGIYVGISDRAADSEALYEKLVESFRSGDWELGGLEKKILEVKTDSGAAITYTTFGFHPEQTGMPGANMLMMTFHRNHYSGYLTLNSEEDLEGMLAYINKLSARLDKMLGY